MTQTTDPYELSQTPKDKDFQVPQTTTGQHRCVRCGKPVGNCVCPPKTTSEAAQIAYDILAPLGCKNFDDNLRRATKLITEALEAARRKAYKSGRDAPA